MIQKAMDPGLNNLLKWSIENTNPSESTTTTTTTTTTQPEPRSTLNEAALRSLMGGPSEADLMKQSMTVILNPESTHTSKITAFDNLEQLIESIDNANNMEPLGLWTPLLSQLENANAEIRSMAAWCIGTAVQNNVKAQERFLAINGIPLLCGVVADDTDKAVRKKAVYALSSAVRNYQPGMNEVVKFLPKDVVGSENVSADDMDAVDEIMVRLRER